MAYVQRLLNKFLKDYREKNNPCQELLLRITSLDPKWKTLRRLPHCFFIKSSRLADQQKGCSDEGMYIFEASKESRNIMLSVNYTENAPMDPNDPSLSKCHRIVHEIKTTEKNFVGQLEQLLELNSTREPFLVMCQEQEPAFVKIFSTAKNVHTLNSGLLKDLEDMKVVHEEVGTIFSKVAPYLQMYKSYIEFFDTCNVHLSRMKVPNEMQLQLQQMSSLLITPVQRIPRYRLLLQELYGCTPMQHGRAAIQAALDRVTVSADHVNEMLRKAQDSMEYAKTFEKFEHCGVMPQNAQRKLLKEEALKKIDRNSQPRLRRFFIVTDGLAYGNNNNPDLSEQADVNWFFCFDNSLRVSPIDRYALESQEIKYNFRIETTVKSFDVETTSETSRNSWISEICEARTAHRSQSKTRGKVAAKKWKKGYDKMRLVLHNSTGHIADDENGDSLERNEVMAPVLASRKDCAVCGMVFSFLHQHRHKMKFCKSCGEGVCHVCSLHKIPLNTSRYIFHKNT